MLRFGGLRLFDTPGLESAFIHNTQAAEQWTPHIDVGLVGVPVDSPLSQHDLTLIRRVLEYTPRFAILLTKADLLNEPEQIEVLRFVKDQLRKNISEPLEVFAHSTRLGHEQLACTFEETFIERRAGRFRVSDGPSRNARYRLWFANAQTTYAWV